jgi:hypothetical protein
MSAARRKGTAWESAVCAYLVAHGFPYAERRALRGRNDAGDISGVVSTVVECKATKELCFPEAVDEAKAAAARVGATRWVAVVKRRNRGVERAYAVMDLEQWCRLMGDGDAAGPTTTPA